MTKRNIKAFIFHDEKGGRRTIMDLILSAATHRSGSTLLQRIFNARKKTLVWGEHLGVLSDFQKIYQKVLKISENGKKSRNTFFKNGENPNQWMAIMAPSKKFIENATVQSAKTFLDALYEQNKEGHDCIGFKEVRYGVKELSILQKCYPEAKFILLVRNPLNAWMSYPKTWGEYRSVLHFAKQWNDNVTYYLNLAKSNPNAYLFQYEKIISKEVSTVDTLTQLAQISKKEMDHVLAEKIRGSSKKKSITINQVAVIKRICGKNMKLLSYL